MHLHHEKSNPKNLEKTKKNKKNKKNNIPGLLEKEKCKNQKNLEKTKKNKKNKKNNIPELLSVDPISKLLEYCFFWFSRGFFDFCLFSLFQESWNIVFFGFFGFLEVFLIFAFFLFQESWNIVFFGFFGFLEVFWTRFFMMKMHYILDDVY